MPFSIDGGTPLDEPVLDRCGVHDAGGGRLVLDKSPYVENSFGTVNGGVMAIVAEAAAVAAVGGGRAVDLQIHYLEQVRQGPREPSDSESVENLALRAVHVRSPLLIC